jgi:hypothetical protein
MHGYAVARFIRDGSGGALQVLDGALYTSLHRMEHRGWVEATWGISDRGKRAKFYQLTAGGGQPCARRRPAGSATWPPSPGCCGRRRPLPSRRPPNGGPPPRTEVPMARDPRDRPPSDRPTRDPLWRRYLRFWRVDVAADVDAEIAFHLAEREAALVARGLRPADARAQAEAEFGDVGAVRARLRAMGEARERRRGWGERLETLARDVRYAARSSGAPRRWWSPWS